MVSRLNQAMHERRERGKVRKEEERKKKREGKRTRREPRTKRPREKNPCSFSQKY